MATQQDTLRELFVTGLVNAHAVEKQALSIMSPQVSRIEHYPEVDRIAAIGLCVVRDPAAGGSA